MLKTTKKVDHTQHVNHSHYFAHAYTPMSRQTPLKLIGLKPRSRVHAPLFFSYFLAMRILCNNKMTRGEQNQYVLGRISQEPKLQA